MALEHRHTSIPLDKLHYAAAPQSLEYTLAIEDFDQSLLARGSRSSRPSEAVEAYLESEFRRFGGWYDVQVDEYKIRVRWTPTASHLMCSTRWLRSSNAARLLVLSYSSSCSWPMSLTLRSSTTLHGAQRCGRLDEAERHLNRALEIEPGFSNARVALGVALQRRGRPPRPSPL